MGSTGRITRTSRTACAETERPTDGVHTPETGVLANSAPHYPIIRGLPGETQARHRDGLRLERLGPRPIQASKPDRSRSVSNGIREGRIKPPHVVLHLA